MECCSKSARDSSSPFDSLLFDLDNTLYSLKTGIGEAVKQNIEDFLIERCGFSPDEALSRRVELYKTYGSTLAGLLAQGYDVDADDYHSVVHGRLNYHLIKPDSQLCSLLRSIPQRKIIFTNSDIIHAMTVLKRLGLEDCFEQIVCLETMNPNLSKSAYDFPVVLKPSPEAMQIAIHETSINPRRTLFLDDNVRNIAAGKAVGLRTVLVGKTVKTKEADYALETVKDLPKVVPEIWVIAMYGGDSMIGAATQQRDRLHPHARRSVMRPRNLTPRCFACVQNQRMFPRILNTSSQLRKGVQKELFCPRQPIMQRTNVVSWCLL